MTVESRPQLVAEKLASPLATFCFVTSAQESRSGCLSPVAQSAEAFRGEVAEVAVHLELRDQQQIPVLCLPSAAKNLTSLTYFVLQPLQQPLSISFQVSLYIIDTLHFLPVAYWANLSHFFGPV